MIILSLKQLVNEGSSIILKAIMSALPAIRPIMNGSRPIQKPTSLKLSRMWQKRDSFRMSRGQEQVFCRRLWHKTQGQLGTQGHAPATLTMTEKVSMLLLIASSPLSWELMIATALMPMAEFGQRWASWICREDRVRKQLNTSDHYDFWYKILSDESKHKLFRFCSGLWWILIGWMAIKDIGLQLMTKITGYAGVLTSWWWKFPSKGQQCLVLLVKCNHFDVAKLFEARRLWELCLYAWDDPYPDGGIYFGRLSGRREGLGAEPMLVDSPCSQLQVQMKLSLLSIPSSRWTRTLRRVYTHITSRNAFKMQKTPKDYVQVCLTWSTR